jgi:hypothetical protein
MARIVRLEKLQENPDPMGLARAKIAEGDWYLWWDRRARAIQCYEAAWAVVANDGSELTNPEALFSEPVELPESPVFHPGSITAQAEQQALATVLFNVTRSGQVKKIEIVEQDPPADMGARITLFNMMRDMRFRPIVRDGEVVAAEAVVRVYRYDY